MILDDQDYQSVLQFVNETPDCTSRDVIMFTKGMKAMTENLMHTYDDIVGELDKQLKNRE